MYGRLLLFKVEPYWDWNQWYGSSCLINNPFYAIKSLRESDCYSCEDIDKIERKVDLKSEIIAENFIRNKIPVIIGSDVIKNEMKKWAIANTSFDIKDLEEIYDENDWKNVCMFRTNINIKDHLTLLKKMRARQFSEIKWYAHWENCNKKTEKQLRKYYLRPKIIPSMLELTKSNWIVVSKNYIGLKFKLIDPSPGTQVLLMIQIKGQNRIKLEPKEFCASRDCTTIYEVLHRNEMLVLNAKLWNLFYSPNAENSFDLNLAIIIGAIYD